MLTVVQAAQLLEVSEQEVRRLISIGELAADRVGERVLAIDEGTVRRRAAQRPGRGRPWSPLKAWAALWHLSGLPVDWLSAAETRRLHQRLEIMTADQLAIATRQRARMQVGRILPEYLPSLLQTEQVVRTGVSAAADAGADILTSAACVEVYGHSDLIERYGVSLTSRNPNITLRTPEDGLPLLDDRDAMPAAVVAADLLAATEPRTARAGRDLLARLLGAAR